MNGARGPRSGRSVGLAESSAVTRVRHGHGTDAGARHRDQRLGVLCDERSARASAPVRRPGPTRFHHAVPARDERLCRATARVRGVAPGEPVPRGGRGTRTVASARARQYSATAGQHHGQTNTGSPTSGSATRQPAASGSGAVGSAAAVMPSASGDPSRAAPDPPTASHWSTATLLHRCRLSIPGSGATGQTCARNRRLMVDVEQRSSAATSSRNSTSGRASASVGPARSCGPPTPHLATPSPAPRPRPARPARAGRAPPRPRPRIPPAAFGAR